MVQVLVVAFVAISIYLYMRSKHLAKMRWLQRLDLPGLWQWQEGDATLTLIGSTERGTFIATELTEDSSGDNSGDNPEDNSGGKKGEANTVRGEWTLTGHEMTLVAPGYRQVLEVTLYQPGSIGLQDESGARRAYSKESSNVVPLRKG
jgi:hypothetical protein